MNPVQAQVLEFHKAGGHLINHTPALIPPETITLRKRLIEEEILTELFPAMDNGNLIAIADALADALYVIYGTAISYGIDMEPISAEIHRSNMTKFGKPGEYRDTCDASGKSIKDAGGKTLKPSTYEPPDLEPILAAQPSLIKDTLSQNHPHYQLFCEFIIDHLTTHNCSNQHTATIAFLTTYDFNIKDSLSWLKETGACCCDCEVFYNTFYLYPPKLTDNTRSFFLRR